MSKLAEQIEKLKEQEKKLFRETRKVEFLNHILASVQNYSDDAFADVHEEVTLLVDDFVKKTIEAIETGSIVNFSVPTNEKTTKASSNEAATSLYAPSEETSEQPREEQVSVNDKMTFAMNNRHLGGKQVSIANDKNVTIQGQVVGLDAPWVLVKTDTGPVIKVPLEKVSLQ